MFETYTNYGTYFDTKLSMFCLVPTATKEGATCPKKGRRAPQPSAEARRRVMEHPELLVHT